MTRAAESRHSIHFCYQTSIMASKPVRTYGSRTRCAPQLSSPPSTLSSSPPATQRNKRQASSSPCKGGEPPKKRRALGFSSSINTKAKVFVKKTPAKVKPAQKKLTQLHFSVDSSILVSCPRCGLSYTRGAPGDEALHRCHCARVQRGMEWGREEERERGRPGLNLVEVENPVRLTDGRRGRIVCYRADAGGKIGAKVTHFIIVWHNPSLLMLSVAILPDNCPAGYYQPYPLCASVNTCHLTRLQDLSVTCLCGDFVFSCKCEYCLVFATREDRWLRRCSANHHCDGHSPPHRTNRSKRRYLGIFSLSESNTAPNSIRYTSPFHRFGV